MYLDKQYSAKNRYDMRMFLKHLLLKPKIDFRNEDLYQFFRCIQLIHSKNHLNGNLCRMVQENKQFFGDIQFWYLKLTYLMKNSFNFLVVNNTLKKVCLCRVFEINIGNFFRDIGYWDLKIDLPNQDICQFFCCKQLLNSEKHLNGRLYRMLD